MSLQHSLLVLVLLHQFFLSPISVFVSSQSAIGSFDNDGVSPSLNVARGAGGAISYTVPVAANGRLRWIQHRAVARDYVLRGELERARLSYSSLLRTKTDSLRARSLSDLHLELGQVFHLLGDTDAAHHHYRRSQSYGPQSYQPQVRLAQLASSLGRVDDAIAHYAHALFFNNTHRLSLHNLGSLSFLSLNLENFQSFLSLLASI